MKAQPAVHSDISIAIRVTIIFAKMPYYHPEADTRSSTTDPCSLWLRAI